MTVMLMTTSTTMAKQWMDGWEEKEEKQFVCLMTLKDCEAFGIFIKLDLAFCIAISFHFDSII